MEQHTTVEQSFLEMYDQLADGIYRHCFFRVNSKELAEDLTQDTFTKAWNYLLKGKAIDNPKAFLHHIAGNLVIDYYRKKKELSLDALAEDGYDPKGDGAEDILEDSAAKQAIASLQQLDVEYREALTLRFVNDLSIGEIAETMALSENVVSVRIHRGVQKLKKILHYEKPD